MTEDSSSAPTKKDQEGEGQTDGDRSSVQASVSSSSSSGIRSAMKISLGDVVSKGADWTVGKAQAVYKKGSSSLKMDHSGADKLEEEDAEAAALVEEEPAVAAGSVAKDPDGASENATWDGAEKPPPSATTAGSVAADSPTMTTEEPPISSEDLRRTLALNLGPGCEFLVRDTTLAVLPPLAVTIYLTYRHWELVTSEGLVPPLVSISWVVLAFILGWERGHHRMSAILDAKMSQAQSRPYEDLSKDEKVVERYGLVESREEEEKHSHSMFERMMNKFSEKTKLDIDVKFKSPKVPIVSSLYSGLKSKSSWRENVDSSSELMKRLLRNKQYRRKWLEVTDESEETAAAPVTGRDDQKSSKVVKPEMTEPANLGSIDIKQINATKKRGDEVIEPAFRLRGVDIFMTDCPEEKIWELQALNDCGLRDKPTFVINVQMPWANVVIYFEMPEWVKDFESSLMEKEDDPADKKALKRFLKGDGAYRTERFSFLPCLVAGPLPIRMMAPPGEELTVEGTSLPMAWHVSHAKKHGQAPLLGLDIEAASEKMLRSASSLVKRYIGSITVDIAIVIEEEDAGCCLGLWRFDKPNLRDFPALPEKTMEEDVKRASTIVTLTPEQLQSIAVGAG